MSENIRDVLNRVYKHIVEKSKEFVTALEKSQSNYKVTSGFFNGHYHKDYEGQYLADAYPIMVISIIGLCDIEVDFDSITVTTKLSKVQTQIFDWKVLDGTSFEVYGVDNYLIDYGSNQGLDAICEKILPSTEKEFFISFYLPVIISANEIITMINTLRSNEFYY